MTTTETNFSERVLLRIHELRQQYQIDMVEATTMFCEEADICPSDLVKQLTPTDIQRLKQAAINGSYVRRQVAEQGATLPL